MTDTDFQTNLVDPVVIPDDQIDPEYGSAPLHKVPVPHPMNKGVKRRWIRALRRKKNPYQQGKGKLATYPAKNPRANTEADRLEPNGPAKYCCLGVLADVLTRTGECGAFPRNTVTDMVEIQYGNPDGTKLGFSYLPDPIAVPLGLSYGTQVGLASMNDKGATFEQIADWIEENL